MDSKNEMFDENTIFDTDVTGKVTATSENFLGDAHEHYVVAIMMRLGFEVALVEAASGPYDLLLNVYSSPPENEEELAGGMTLRVQAKTASSSIPFQGGVRAGRDRDYTGGEDYSYVYNTSHNDLIIGVDKEDLSLYILPTRFVEDFGTKSKSTNKLEPLRNRWEILLNWNDSFLREIKRELPDFS